MNSNTSTYTPPSPEHLNNGTISLNGMGGNARLKAAFEIDASSASATVSNHTMPSITVTSVSPTSGAASGTAADGSHQFMMKQQQEHAHMGGMHMHHDMHMHDTSANMVDPHAADLGGDIKSAVLGIIKAMVGPAILYLPHGFVAAGYLVALPIMAVSTVMYLHSSKCLLETWKWESEKQLVPQTDDLELVVEDPANPNPQALTQAASQPKQHQHQPKSLSYPELAYRAFGTRGETLVKVGIALMQSGVCLTYLIFVPHNLHSSLLNISGWNVHANVFLFLMLCMQIPLSWIRDIRKFTTTNALANACILYGLLVCLCFAFGEATAPYDPYTHPPSHKATNETVVSLEDDYDTEDHGPVGNLWQHFVHLDPLGDHWILFIGTSVLLFEGSITLLIPLQEAVQPPSPEDPNNTDRERFPSVYPQVILGIQVFYVVFAVSCWMSFGDEVNTVLTTSLPPGFMATTVQLAYSVAVLFTFPLQNYPALEIACHSIAQSLEFHIPNIPLVLLERDTIAAELVCILGIVAVTTMESLDKVVSLTGALIGIPIAFMIPPLIHSQLVPNLPQERLQKNYAVAALGSVAMVVASITTILQWND